MPYREEPRERLLRLFNEIDRKMGKVSKWDLKVIAGGTDDQFRAWVSDFLLAGKFIKEIKEGKHTYYAKTENGKILHGILKNWHVFGRAFRRIGGKRLKRKTEI